MARNCASTMEGVTGYLPVGVKRTTDDLRKIQHPTSPWKQPLGGVAYRKWMLWCNAQESRDIIGVFPQYVIKSRDYEGYKRT